MGGCILAPMVLGLQLLWTKYISFRKTYFVPQSLDLTPLVLRCSQRMLFDLLTGGRWPARTALTASLMSRRAIKLKSHLIKAELPFITEKKKN